MEPTRCQPAALLLFAKRWRCPCPSDPVALCNFSAPFRCYFKRITRNPSSRASGNIHGLWRTSLDSRWKSVRLQEFSKYSIQWLSFWKFLSGSKDLVVRDINVCFMLRAEVRVVQAALKCGISFGRPSVSVSTQHTGAGKFNVCACKNLLAPTGDQKSTSNAHTRGINLTDCVVGVGEMVPRRWRLSGVVKIVNSVQRLIPSSWAYELILEMKIK